MARKSLKKGKKREEKSEGKEEKGKIRRKQERQIKIFLLVMFFLLVFIFAIYMFYLASVKFRYAGLEFEKVREGKLILYRTPVLPIFLRNDPRELRDIKIDSRIILKRKIGIAGNEKIIEECEDSVLSATILSIFLGKAGLQPFSATTNKSQAEKLNMSYVSCELESDYSAILFEKADVAEIEKEGNCYILKVSDCNILEVTERFIVASYAHSRGIEV